MKTVYLADDHGMFLQGITSLFAGMDDFRVIGSSVAGWDALEKIRELKPDIAVLDGAMPDIGGVDVIERALSDHGCPTRFLLLTMFTHPQLLADAQAAGARGCISKKDASRELRKALETITENETDFFVSAALRPLQKSIDSGEIVGLTPRERDLMKGIAAGLTNKEVADRLGIAVRTVDTHRTRLMKKIGARNTADIVRYAMRMGVGTC